MAQETPSTPEEISPEELRRRKNEEAWLSPEASLTDGSMVGMVRSQISTSDRKLRLFSVACAHSVWSKFDDNQRKAIEAAELCADGKINLKQLRKVKRRYEAQFGSAAYEILEDLQLDLGGNPHFHTVARNATALLADGSGPDYRRNNDQRAEAKKQVGYLRDVIGNPFDKEPVLMMDQWRGTDVLKVASVIYEEKRFEDMPILADALEDAGCTDERILNHLRGPGPHVKGCWCLDLILGKQ